MGGSDEAGGVSRLFGRASDVAGNCRMEDDCRKLDLPLGLVFGFGYSNETDLLMGTCLLLWYSKQAVRSCRYMSEKESREASVE